jgi:hypothetical protein
MLPSIPMVPSIRIHSALGSATLGLLLACVLASPALANTITVSNTNDAGAGSLRAAIEQASAGDTIVLPASASPYAVTSAQLDVGKNLTIAGAGARSTVISAEGTAHRVLGIEAGAVTITGVTITGGGPGNNAGAGIDVNGGASLTAVNVAVNANSLGPDGGNGGGIYGNTGSIVNRSQHHQQQRRL